LFVGLVFAVHFWAPTFKWGISIANIADFAKPPEKLSYPQQIGKVPIHPWLCLFHILCTHIPCMLLCIFSVCKPIAVSTCHARHLASRWEQKLILLLPDSILIILYYSILLSLLSFGWFPAVTCTGVIWSRYSTVITPVSFENHLVLFFFLLCLSLRVWFVCWVFLALAV